ncbi:exported hypothetical protein [Desulfamplus magnetovallimortis]|uniref:Uncharacterized protein n=1 Tax=Desulfamplus magnetovallimortis TaxID=1246637 RepID=A0A1W1HI80_9BACT|nr:family 43 glycosylhydrolase [Desulfamplus magnetovallimortis]SLM32078.1 exported hypothetical protein [Desulfamplus magnetovallimortis]
MKKLYAVLIVLLALIIIAVPSFANTSYPDLDVEVIADTDLVTSAIIQHQILKRQCADPDAEVIGDTVFITSTYNALDRKMHVHSISLADFKSFAGNSSHWLLGQNIDWNIYTLDPGNGFQNISMAPEIDYYDNELYFWMSAKQTTDDWHTIYYSQDGNNWEPINYVGSPYGYSDGDASSCGQACERRKMRIDSHLFNDNGTKWLFYTYFHEGNKIAGFKWEGPGSQTVPIDFVSSASASYSVNANGDNIMEAPTVFKRGSYYYLIWSEGSYLGAYHMRYRMATSVQGLANSSTYILAYPKSVAWDSTNQQYTASANIGHCSTIEVDGNIWMFYHIGRPNSGSKIMEKPTPNIYRYCYVTKLNFHSNGKIVLLTW